MFSRSGSQPEGDQPESTPASAEAPRSEAARAFDQVLSDLHPAGVPPIEPDPQSAAASASEHAATLRATRDAHQEAQQMLASAAETRRTASEEAERIVLEARDAAERTRQELAGWAAAQRAKVDALATDMVESANRDADAIRAEALRTSMAEAEETSRAYIADAAERAHQDAEAIRDEARHVLNRATELAGQAAEAVGDLTSTVSDILDRLQASRTAMADLLAENRRAAPAEDPDLPEDPEDAGAATESPDTGEPMSLADDPDGDPADDPDDDLDGSLGEDLDLLPADEPDVSEDPVQSPDLPLDRQLGSLFRRHGQRGE